MGFLGVFSWRNFLVSHKYKEMLYVFHAKVMVVNVAVYHGKVMVLVENIMVLYDYYAIYHSFYRYSKHIILTTMVFWTCINIMHFQKYHGTIYTVLSTKINTLAIYHGKVMELDGNTLVLYDYHNIYHRIYRYSKHIISNFHGILDMYLEITMHFQKYRGTTTVHEFQYQSTFPSIATIVLPSNAIFVPLHCPVLGVLNFTYHGIYHGTSKNTMVLPNYMSKMEVPWYFLLLFSKCVFP